MDPMISDAGEAMLRAWLGLTAVICNRRMVSGMTFNEAVVCNHLHHQTQEDPEHPLTATDLCEKTSLLKSQMNGVLASLERQGYVRRARSRADRRQMDLFLTESGFQAYWKSHRQAASMLTELVEQMGLERAGKLTNELNEVIAAIQKIQDTRQKGTL